MIFISRAVLIATILRKSMYLQTKMEWSLDYILLLDTGTLSLVPYLNRVIDGIRPVGQMNFLAGMNDPFGYAGPPVLRPTGKS